MVALLLRSTKWAWVQALMCDSDCDCDCDWFWYAGQLTSQRLRITQMSAAREDLNSYLLLLSERKVILCFTRSFDTGCLSICLFMRPWVSCQMRSFFGTKDPTVSNLKLPRGYRGQILRQSTMSMSSKTSVVMREISTLTRMDSNWYLSTPKWPMKILRMRTK